MLIATDGACKRLGKPDCTATGVAWFKTNEGDMFYKAHFETASTSQRGEIWGLIEALRYAADNTKDEDIIIITDSEYLHNTVMLDWCFKWRMNDWIAGSGSAAKNADLWEIVCSLIDRIGKENVWLQWTKGHLISYTAGNTKTVMQQDISGITLYSNVLSIANRPSERDRVVAEFNKNRAKHDKDTIPDDIAIEWVVANVLADCLAGYVETAFDQLYLGNQEQVLANKLKKETNK